MSKRCLVSASLIAVVAFLSFGSNASANHIVDPDCDGTPYGNNFEVHDFSVTTDSPFAYVPSAQTARGLVCGTTLHNNLFNCGSPPIGANTLNVRVDLSLPADIEINRTSTMADGVYAGRAEGNIAACAGLLSTMTSGGGTIRVERDIASSDCPGDAIACYRTDGDGDPSPGYSNSWVTQVPSGSYVLRTGPVHTSLIGEGGFTRFQIRLCAYAGTSGGAECGDSSQPWLGKNGRPDPTYGCAVDTSLCVDPPGGCALERSIVRLTVTNKAGQTAPTAYDCIGWDCNLEWADNGCRPPGPGGRRSGDENPRKPIAPSSRRPGRPGSLGLGRPTGPTKPGKIG